MMAPFQRLEDKFSGVPLALGFWRLADWKLERGELLNLIEQSLDLGISVFDHADIYGDYSCERLFGEALALSPLLRESMTLVTKCGIAPISGERPSHLVKHYDSSRRHIVSSVETSLENLCTDRLDLLLLHRPDPLMQVEEVAEAFEALQEEGKVLHFGVSNFSPSQLDLLSLAVKDRLVTNQIEASVLHTEPLFDGTLDQCQMLAMTPMVWSPMGGGRLFDGQDERSRRVRVALEEVAEEVGGAGIDQVALAWLRAHPSGMLPVIGTGRIDRIRDAVDSLDLTLGRQQWFGILEASLGEGVA